MEPENREVSPRYVLKYSTRGFSRVFQLFDTSEKPNHFVASRRRWLESQGRNGARQESGQNEWHIKEQWQKAPPCPDRTLTTPLPPQSSSSAKEEEVHWVLIADRRRRCIAFENFGQGNAEILGQGDDVKVGITELQERQDISEKVGISVRQVAQQAMSQNGQTIFDIFRQGEEELCQLGQVGRTAERSGGLGKMVSKHEAGGTGIESKTRNI